MFCESYLIPRAFRQKRQKNEQKREALDDAFGVVFGRVVPCAYFLDNGCKNCCLRNYTSSEIG
jgi:hypothetical protein